MRVDAIPADTVNRLRSLDRRDLDRLAVVAQIELRRGKIVSVPKTAPLEPENGVRRVGRMIQLGLTSEEITEISPNALISDAVSLMRKKAIRRIPVMEGGKPVGILSIGDLAMAQDPNSALGSISAAPPNR